MQRKGVAIVIVLLVLSIMVVVGLAVVTLGTGSLAMAGSQRVSERAYYAAEAGLAITLVRLQADANYAGASETMVGSPDSYTTTVYRLPMAPPAGVVLPGPDYRYVQSVGTTPGGVRREVGAMVKISTSLFNYAAFAKEQVNLADASMVDWYDSTTGLVPPGGKADIGSNWVGANAIVIEDDKAGTGSWVKGAAHTAPGAPPGAFSLDPNSKVDNGQISMASTQNLAPVVLPPPRGPATPPPDAKVVPGDPALALDLPTINTSTVLAPGIYRKVEVDAGAEVTLVNGGTYVFEEFNIKNGTIHVPVDVDVPIKIYVTNRFNMEKGSVINDTAKPPLMQVFGAQVPDPKDPSKLMKTEINLKSEKKGDGTPTTGYYSVYAPDADVKIEGGYDDKTYTYYPSHLYGAVIGKNVRITKGSVLTYDLALKNASGGSSNLEVLFHDRL